MRVIIVGAGLGGLALAQGLSAAGEDVTVFERDIDVAATGGYRIHLTAPACEVLRRHLSPDLYQALQAESADSRSFQRFAFTDQRLRVLATEQLPDDEERLLVGRVPLRRLLAHGVDVRYGTSIRQVRRSGERASVVDDSGRVHEADLVVGADGVRSVVSTHLAGCHTASRIGGNGTAGRVWLAPGDLERLPTLQSGPAIAIGGNGIGAFLSLHRPDQPLVDPTLAPLAATEPASLVWGMFGASALIPDHLVGADGPSVLRNTSPLLDGWLPALVDLVEHSDPATVAAYRFFAADPARLAPWPAGPITALGDAVHAMPPTGGQSGSTAIRDAGVLAARLAEVRTGQSGLGTVIEAYQREMRTYAAPAVRESVAPAQWIARMRHPAVRGVARLVLPAFAGAVATVRRARAR